MVAFGELSDTGLLPATVLLRDEAEGVEDEGEPYEPAKKIAGACEDRPSEDRAHGEPVRSGARRGLRGRGDTHGFPMSCTGRADD